MFEQNRNFRLSKSEFMEEYLLRYPSSKFKGYTNEIILDTDQPSREKLWKFYCELLITLSHLRQTED